MTHTILCKKCGDIVIDDKHFTECSDDCYLIESKDDDFGKALEDEIRRMNYV